MGKSEDEVEMLTKRGLAGRSMLDPWPHGYPGQGGAVPSDKVAEFYSDTSQTKIHTLVPKPEPTIRDEILEMLAELTDDITSGRVEPSHLIMGWAEETTVNGQQASSFIWDCVGLNRFEAMGHLQAYSAKLANGEGD